MCCTKLNTRLQRTSKDELIIRVVVGPQAATAFAQAQANIRHSVENGLKEVSVD